MEQERYQQQYKAFVQQAEQRMNELCDVYLPVKAQISQAARYSLLGGGKRVRAGAGCLPAGGRRYRSCSRLCRGAGNAALLFPDSR